MIRKYSVFLFCLFLFQSATAADPAGLFMSVKGNIQITSGGSTQAAKIGSKVFVGDVIVTGADSRAKLTMKDRNNIFVSPNSTFKITAYDTGEKRNAEIVLKAGKIRNELNNKYDGEKTKFQIKTPTAVAGVRGTDFVTSFDVPTQTTEIVTLKGNVVLNNLAANGRNISIPAGQTSTVRGSEPPAPPQPTPVEKMSEVQQDFSVSNNAPPPPPSTAANDSSKGSDTNSDSTGRTPASDGTTSSSTDMATGAPAGGNPTRVVDKQDQSPETFDRVPNSGTSSTSNPDLARGIPGTNFNTQPGSRSTQTNPVDSVRQTQQPVSVEIKPTLPK